MEEEMVQITKKEYKQLLQDSEILGALMQNGIDNWEWYDDAINSLGEKDLKL